MKPSDHTYRVSTSVARRVGLAVVCTAAVTLAGCSGNSFIGRKFDDFTAHYNKFYNANRTFQEQERKLETGDVKIDTDRFLATYELPQQRGRSAELEKVITKCADLLRNHPRSKWVDDALMLIGKSYFYQSNFVGAEQKFNEIINLDGELKQEAEFWLARTLVAGQSSAAGEEIIGAALAKEDLRKEWRARFLLLRGDLRTEVGLFQQAIDDIEEGVEDVDDGDTAARAYFLLGQLHEQEGNYEQAVKAYERSRKQKPLYELAYAAMVGELRVMGLHVDSEKALDRLEDAMRENKHYQNRFHLLYLHARILAAAGDPLAARESFFEQLYPSDPTRKTNLRGEVHYRLAELYRDYLGDFYAAGVHYDTASTVLRSPPAQNEQFAPDAIVDSRDMAATFRDYRETLDQVTRMDSLLYLGSLDKAAFDSAVAVVRVQLAEQAARIQEELERRRTESRFRQAAADTDVRAQTARTPTTQGAGSEAFGFLNHKNLQRVQEAFLSFKEIWGDRPLVPGWRREEAVALAQRQALEEKGANGEAEETASTTQGVRFLPPVDLSEVPRDSASQAEMRVERAQARYRLANVLFLSLGLPDSAARWYRMVIDEEIDDPVTHRALYAMAEVHEALGDHTAATRTLERVIERYPNSVFADKARVLLGLEEETAAAVAADSLEMATARYEDAYAIWKRRDYSGAIDEMVRLAADFPKHEVAAKALLAAARIYLEKANRDGDDFYGVVPIGDSVFTEEEINAAIAAATPPPAPADTSAVMPDTTEISEIRAPDAEVAGEVATLVDTTVSPVGEDSVATPAIKSGDQADPLANVRKDAVEVATLVDTTATPVGRDSAAAPVTKSDDLPDPVARVRKEVGDERLQAQAERLRKRSDEIAARRDTSQSTQPRIDDSMGAALAQRPKLEVRLDSNVVADTVNAFVGESAPAVPDTSDAEAIAAAEFGAPPDSTSVPSDSALHPPDTAVARTVQKPAPPKIPEIDWGNPEYFVKGLVPVPMTIHAVYNSVAKHFGDSPYGKRATELREALEAVRTALAIAERDAEQAAAGAVTPETPTDPLDKVEDGGEVGQPEPAEGTEDLPSAPSDSSLVDVPAQPGQPARRGEP